MKKIALRELEEAKRDPARFRIKLDSPNKQSFSRSVFLCLRDTIFRFHNAGEDISESLSYLEKRLDVFKNRNKCEKAIDQFFWYVGELADRKWATFRTRLNVSIPLPSPAPLDLECTGQICRIDLVPEGGYVAWLFRSSKPEGWQNELQMPLLQDSVSRIVLGCPIEEVGVGIYSFEEKFVDYRTYSARAIIKAQADLKMLIERMGY